MALNLQSFEQILGTMIRKVQSESGLTDLNPGSVVLSILEAASESDFAIASQILAALDSIDLDRSEEAVLDLQAAKKGLSRLPASKASGPVSITDSGFSKLSTTVYQGLPAPISNSSIVYVNDATNWPATGSIYIGRGTTNVEGPILYSSIASVGNYFKITLSSSTNKFHNTGESVILAQGGNRTIPSGTQINTGVIGAAAPIAFTILDSSTILDGENSITGVSCICQSLGTTGNIPSNAITNFPTPPFPNLTASNDNPFTNARDEEGDIELRDRIKRQNATNTSGTNRSILNAVTNLVAADEQKRILAASIAEATGNDPTILYVDDGTAYEPIYSGVGQEIVLDNVVSGQKFLQLVNPALVKAQIASISSQPFGLSDGMLLTVLVGGVVSTHTFSASDFFDITNATAYEIVSSINANSQLLFTARTAEGATKIVLTAKSDSDEYISISSPASGADANNVFNFQTGQQFTLKLYKNDNLLTKDGASAFATSISFPWGLSSSSYTLIVSVDGTPSVTYTFNSANLAPYSPQTAPLSIWASAISATIPGATGVVSGNKLLIVSNKGESSAASLQILGGTLVTAAGVFAVATVTGSSSDYSLVRGTGQVVLVTPAASGDTFKAGTTDTRAYVQSSSITSGIVNIASTGNIYVLNDSAASVISTGAVAGVAISVTSYGTGYWRYSAPANTFVNVEIGDWAVIWDTSITHPDNKGFFRISNTDASTYVDVQKTNGNAGAYTLANNDAFKIIRSSGLIQSFVASAPVNQSLAQWISVINANSLVGIEAKVASTNKIRLTTNTFDETVGQIYFLTADVSGQLFNFTIGDKDISAVSHVGFVESANSESGTPLFTAPVLGSTNNSSTSLYSFPITTSITTTPDKMVNFVKAFNSAVTNKYGNNVFNWSGVRNIVNGSATINLVSKPDITDRLPDDRAYLSNSFDFADLDSLFMIFDNSPIQKSVKANLYRTISINSGPSPTVNSFSATDIDGGSVGLTTSFGNSFDFSNYKLWSRARAVVDADGANNGFIVRSSKYGPYGNQFKFYLGYPAGPNTSYSYSVNSGNTTGGIDLTVALPSDSQRTAGYDGTTSFTISYAAPNATFLWNAGTTPTLVSNGVVAGDIVYIGPNTNFTSGNQGVFRVSNVSQTTFTITNYNASATSESISKTLGATTNLKFYPISATATATNLISWMNSNVNSYITTNLGVGESGAGIVNRVIRDFSGATQNYVQLVDGENWVNNATLTSSPQFTLESNYSISTGGLYTLVGEQAKLIPHTAKQTVSFLGSPAVSGISNLGEIKASSQGGKVQIASAVVGTAGAIKIDGGSANSVGGSIVGTAIPVGSPVSYELIRTTQGSTNGIHPGSWIKLSSGLPLSKNIGLSGGSLAGITLPNVLSITGASFYTTRTHSGDNTTTIQVEQHGAFACYNWTGVGTNPLFTNLIQGDWAVIAPGTAFNARNSGTFRIVRALTSSFWVENASAAQEQVILAANSNLAFYSSDSILPGDTLSLAGGVLNSSNDGTYTVLNVSATNSLTIGSNFVTNASLTSLSGNLFTYINFYNPGTSDFYRPVISIVAPSALGSSYEDIVVGDYVSQLSGKISDSSEFVFDGLNKLKFSQQSHFGIDGYTHYNGLISEATKVVYGDPQNSTLYPGVRATSAYIDIRPPLPKRVQISVGVRLKTGVRFSDIENTVKSSIASVINSSLMGQSIPLGDIITAMTSVDGVLAPSIIFPTYTSSNDVITVNFQEKALIVNQEDISVSLLGN